MEALWKRLDEHFASLKNGLSSSLFRLKQIRSFDQSVLSGRLLAEVTELTQMQRRLRALKPQIKLRWQDAADGDERELDAIVCCKSL